MGDFFNPMSELNSQLNNQYLKKNEKIDISYSNLNGAKLTIIKNMDNDDMVAFAKLKKELGCNSFIKPDDDDIPTLYFSGDQRQKLRKILIALGEDLNKYTIH